MPSLATVRDAFTLLNQRFRALAAPVRVGVVVLLAVVLVSLVYLTRRQTVSTDDLLFSGRTFAASELGEMEAAFAKASLNDYELSNGRVRVPHELRAQYIGALVDANALPANFHVHVDEALRSGNPFESQKTREQRLSYARQKELALAIRAMDGIEDATVQYDETSLGGFPRRKEATAMVGVLCADHQQLEPQRVESLRQLVAAAKAGLKPEDVTVTDLRSGQAFSGISAGNRVPPGSSPYAALKKALEEEWTDKIRQVLSFVPGAQVAVNVELDTDAFQQPADSAATAASDGLRPRRVTASIGIPRTYLAQVWSQRQTYRSGHRPSAVAPVELASIEQEAKQKIEAAVAALLPASRPAAGPSRQVIVTTFDDVTAPTHVAPTAQDSLTTRLRQRANPAVVLLIVAVSVLTLHGVLRVLSGSPISPQQTPVPLRVFPEQRPVDEQPSGAPADAAEPDEKPAGLREELARIVQEDPDAAAHAVQHWIGRAS